MNKGFIVGMVLLALLGYGVFEYLKSHPFIDVLVGVFILVCFYLLYRFYVTVAGDVSG